MAQGARLPSLAVPPVGRIDPAALAQQNLLVGQIARILSNFTPYGPVVYLEQFFSVASLAAQALVYPAAPPATSPRVFPANFYQPRRERLPAVTWPPQGR